MATIALQYTFQANIDGSDFESSEDVGFDKEKYEKMLIRDVNSDEDRQGESSDDGLFAAADEFSHLIEMESIKRVKTRIPLKERDIALNQLRIRREDLLNINPCKNLRKMLRILLESKTLENLSRS